MSDPAALPAPKPEEDEPTVHERHAVESRNNVIDRRVMDDAGAMPPAPTMYEVNGHRYPATRVKNCKTCNLQPLAVRAMVEEQILAGYNKEAIASQLDPGLGITARNLLDHARNGHMPLDLDTQHKLMEVAYEQAGDPTNPSLATDIGMANTIIRKVFKKLSSGKLDDALTVDDGLAAAKFLREVKRMGGDESDMEAVVERFAAIWDAIAEVGGEEIAEAVHDFMSTDPILRKIKGQAFGTPDMIEAESEEEDLDEG